MKGTRFGVELECTGITRFEAAKILAHYFFGYIPYDLVATKGHDYEVCGWKIKHDGSIRTAEELRNGTRNRSFEPLRVEIVSPICTYSDIPVIQDIARRILEVGAYVNSSCGLHIHVCGAAHTPDSINRLLHMMFRHQKAIFRILNVEPMRIDNYCSPIPQTLIDCIGSADIALPLHIKWYRYWGGSASDKRHISRYYCINIHSWFQKGTVEFRLFNGTLDSALIARYIDFALFMSGKALKIHEQQLETAFV